MRVRPALTLPPRTLLPRALPGVQLIELRNNLREYIELTKDLLGITDAPETAAPAPAQPAQTTAQPAPAESSKALVMGEYVSVLYPNSDSYVTATVAEAPGDGKVKVNLLGYHQTIEVDRAAIRPPEILKRSQVYVGLHCEGVYTADSCWYTARIDAVNADGTVAVTYTDYGNSESIDMKHLRLNPKLDHLNKAPPNAVELAAQQLERELAAKKDKSAKSASRATSSGEKKRKDPEEVRL